MNLSEVRERLGKEAREMDKARTSQVGTRLDDAVSEKDNPLIERGEADSSPTEVVPVQEEGGVVAEVVEDDGGAFDFINHPPVLRKEEYDIIIKGIMAHIPLWNIAQKIHCSRQWLSRKIKEDPRLMELWNDARESFVDIAEFQARRLMESGSAAMTMFVLEKMGRSRGWGNTASANGDGEKDKIVIGAISDEDIREAEHDVREANENTDGGRVAPSTPTPSLPDKEESPATALANMPPVQRALVEEEMENSVHEALGGRGMDVTVADEGMPMIGGEGSVGDSGGVYDDGGSDEEYGVDGGF